jgi:hypothetical protein
MEPARSDETAEPPGYAEASYGLDGHWYKDPQPTAVHQVPGVWPWTHQAQPEQIPVVGPTQALRGRAGGPGLAAPPGAVHGLLDSQGRSAWQLAEQVWQESRVSWEPAVDRLAPVDPVVFAGPQDQRPVWAAPADAAGEFVEEQDEEQDEEEEDDEEDGEGDADQAADWAEPVEDWDEPIEERGGPADDRVEPAADEPDADEPGTDEPDADWSVTDGSGAVDDDPGAVPPNAADRGAEHQIPPIPPIGPVGPIGPTGRIRRPSEGWNEYPASGYPGQRWPTGRTGPMPTPPAAFAAMPLGAPVAVEPQAPWSAAETTTPMRAASARPLAEPDELFRAWQGSVRQAAAPRRNWPAPRPGMTARRRRRVWRAAAIGVPAAVIVTVGASAMLLLTGKADEMLAVRGDTTTLAPGASASPAASSTASGKAQSGGTSVTGVMLTGYPGQHGAVEADSMWSAAGITLAVGDADGHPAIWQQAGGSWTLMPAAALRTIGGTGDLTAVAHGPAGWIAVGFTVTGGSSSPLVLASTNGVTWQPVATLVGAAGPDVQFLGVAAGPDGYAVVGRQLIGGRIFASLWWSADLRMWVQGSNGGLDGRLTASAASAAAATATGFVAVGSHGAFAAVWTSPDGVHWALSNVSVPSGARSATLRQVVTSGNTIVATGYADTKAGDIPLAVISTDGGAHWRTIILPVPGGLGVVTALTIVNNRLIAAGQTGRAGAEHFVTWTSSDGLSWSAATPVAGVRQITSMSDSDGTLTGTGTGTGQHGADSSIETFPAR